MSKIVKFVIWTLVGVVVIVIGLAVYIAATFDPNQYKPQIVQAVKDKTQRTLKLEGEIKAGTLHPFAGPVVDQDGKTRVAAGTSMPDDELGKMDYYVQGVASKLPKK